jgi:hypothetical protein
VRTVQLGVGRAYSSVGSGPCVQFSWQWAVLTVQLAVGRAYSSDSSGPCVNSVGSGPCLQFR